MYLSINRLQPKKKKKIYPNAYGFTVQTSSFVSQCSLKNFVHPGEFLFIVLVSFIQVAIFQFPILLFLLLLLLQNVCDGVE